MATAMFVGSTTLPTITASAASNAIALCAWSTRSLLSPYLLTSLFLISSFLELSSNADDASIAALTPKPASTPETKPVAAPMAEPAPGAIIVPIAVPTLAPAYPAVTDAAKFSIKDGSDETTSWATPNAPSSLGIDS